jgi:hypothetical protein
MEKLNRVKMVAGAKDIVTVSSTVDWIKVAANLRLK